MINKDHGRRRYLVASLDYDNRSIFLEMAFTQLEQAKKNDRLDDHQERCLKTFIAEFGLDNWQRKVNDFIFLGSKPLSVMSYHNEFFEQARTAFISGAYYPALVALCALGERILNHMVLELREEFPKSQNYSKVKGNKSFNDWQIMIDALKSWSIISEETAIEFEKLKRLRHGSIHFRMSTYETAREDALEAANHIRRIIDRQFGITGENPWFIPDTNMFRFIKKDWEDDPFAKKFLILPERYFGPEFKHGLGFSEGLVVSDENDYGEGEWSDEEFITEFHKRNPLAVKRENITPIKNRL